MQAGHDRPAVVKTVLHSQASLPPFHCAAALPRLDFDDASLDRAASVRKNGKWSINNSFFARRGFGQSGHMGGEAGGFMPGSLLHRALLHDLENGKVNVLMSRLTKGDEDTTARALSVLMEYYTVLMNVYKVRAARLLAAHPTEWNGSESGSDVCSAELGSQLALPAPAARRACAQRAERCPRPG